MHSAILALDSMSIIVRGTAAEIVGLANFA